MVIETERPMNESPDIKIELREPNVDRPRRINETLTLRSSNIKRADIQEVKKPVVIDEGKLT